MSALRLRLRKDNFPMWPNPENSINDADGGITIGGKTYWAAEGPALESFNVVRKQIERCLTDMEGDLYKTCEESFIPHSISCFMVGRQKMKACPFIVIACFHEAFSKHIMDIIKSSEWWSRFIQEYAGFGRFALLRYPPRHMGTSEKDAHVWIYTSNLVTSLRDIPLFSATEELEPGSHCGVRQATLGNIVYLGEQPYGLTVSHPWLPQRQDHMVNCDGRSVDAVTYEDDIEDSDLESDLDSIIQPDSSSESLPSQHTQSINGRQISGTAVSVGKLDSWSQGTIPNVADWCLIEIHENGFSASWEKPEDWGTYSSHDGRRISIQPPIAVADPIKHATSIFVSASDGHLIQGILNPSQSLICLGPTHRYLSLYIAILTEDLSPGHCGKWVFDKHGYWHGHVVAGTQGSKLVYVMPAYSIANDIKKQHSGRNILLIHSEALNRQLFEAAKIGNKEDILLLLNAGADISTVGGRIGTALHVAAYYGRPDIVRIVLDAGADVNNIGGKYDTALQAAACCGRLDIVLILLDAGADVNIIGGKYNTALQAAVYCGRLDIVLILLDAGADVNIIGGKYNTALQAAIYYGREGVVRILLNAGADVNIIGGECNTALQAAVSYGRQDIVRTLLDAGADVNNIGGEYNTALQAAVYYGHEDIVRILLKAGADVNVLGGEYNTALQAAANQGHEGVVRILLDAGADINTIGGRFGTALQAAAYCGVEGVVRMLLEAGADVNAVGGEYNTALQAAVICGYKGVVGILLDAGADVNIIGEELHAELQAVAVLDRRRAVKPLPDAGADVDTDF